VSVVEVEDLERFEPTAMVVLVGLTSDAPRVTERATSSRSWSWSHLSCWTQHRFQDGQSRVSSNVGLNQQIDPQVTQAATRRTRLLRVLWAAEPVASRVVVAVVLVVIVRERGEERVDHPRGSREPEGQAHEFEFEWQGRWEVDRDLSRLKMSQRELSEACGHEAVRQN
jgi:hypothetical protein